MDHGGLLGCPVVVFVSAPALVAGAPPAAPVPCWAEGSELANLMCAAGRRLSRLDHRGSPGQFEAASSKPQGSFCDQQARIALS